MIFFLLLLAYLFFTLYIFMVLPSVGHFIYSVSFWSNTGMSPCSVSWCHRLKKTSLKYTPTAGETSVTYLYGFCKPYKYILYHLYSMNLVQLPFDWISNIPVSPPKPQCEVKPELSKTVSNKFHWQNPLYSAP